MKRNNADLLRVSISIWLALERIKMVEYRSIIGAPRFYFDCPLGHGLTFGNSFWLANQPLSIVIGRWFHAGSTRLGCSSRTGKLAVNAVFGRVIRPRS
jgi:hypothetical protein